MPAPARKKDIKMIYHCLFYKTFTLLSKIISMCKLTQVLRSNWRDADLHTLRIWALSYLFILYSFFEGGGGVLGKNIIFVPAIQDYLCNVCLHVPWSCTPDVEASEWRKLHKVEHSSASSLISVSHLGYAQVSWMFDTSKKTIGHIPGLVQWV